MKILLAISSYKNGFPYIQDLERELKNQDVFVNILDIENLYLINNDGIAVNIADSFILRLLLRIPKFRTYIRTFWLRKYIKKLEGKYDSVGIHSCDMIYVYLVRELRQLTSNFSVTIWGSDFYRATEDERQKKKKIFDATDLIIFGNPANEEDFVSYYKNYRNKSVVCGFGITKFDIINQTLKKSNRHEIKSQLNLPLDKFIVTIGYNGTVQQQHEKLIDCLDSLPHHFKRKIFLLFQMSYGGSESYKKQVEKRVAACKIDYKLVIHFLSDEETSKLRIATDLVLNAQLTDGFSASIQEHIYAKNIVIVGDWLEYKSLDQSNVYYLKSSEDDFGKITMDVIENYSDYLQLVEDNSNKIYRLSSWTSRLPEWIAIYNGKVRKQNVIHQL